MRNYRKLKANKEILFSADIIYKTLDGSEEGRE